MISLDSIKVEKKFSQIIDEVRKVWGHPNPMAKLGYLYAAWAVGTQVDEIFDTYNGLDTFKEFADIIIIIFQWLDSQSVDPLKLVKWRLETRHVGKTDQILEKYKKKWFEYQKKRLESCKECTPFCIDYDTCLVRKKEMTELQQEFDEEKKDCTSYDWCKKYSEKNEPLHCDACGHYMTTGMY